MGFDLWRKIDRAGGKHDAEWRGLHPCPFLASFFPSQLRRRPKGGTPTKGSSGEQICKLRLSRFQPSMIDFTHAARTTRTITVSIVGTDAVPGEMGIMVLSSGGTGRMKPFSGRGRPSSIQPSERNSYLRSVGPGGTKRATALGIGLRARRCWTMSGNPSSPWLNGCRIATSKRCSSLIRERLGEYLATVQRERKKLHEMTQSRQCFKPTPVLIGELNRHLRGCMNSSPSATPSVPTVRSCATTFDPASATTQSAGIQHGEPWLQHLARLGLIRLSGIAPA